MSGVMEYDWGIPLEEYLRVNSEFPKPPASVEQAKAALFVLSNRPNSENLRDFDGISCATLEDILSLIYYPKEFRSLRTSISLQCFRLLEIYIKHNKVRRTFWWSARSKTHDRPAFRLCIWVPHIASSCRCNYGERDHPERSFCLCHESTWHDLPNDKLPAANDYHDICPWYS